MMNKFLPRILLLSLVTLVSISSSCKKSCKGGSGGNLTLVTKLKHHGVIIPNDSLRPDTVWIKFNVSDWSGAPAGSDMRFIGEFPEDHVHVEGLNCGDFYLYASGWDSSGPFQVTGGRAFSTSQKDGELDVDIAVTE